MSFKSNWFSFYVCVLFLTALLSTGCELQKADGGPGTDGKGAENSDAQNDDSEMGNSQSGQSGEDEFEDEGDDVGYLKQAQNLFNKAKKAGQTTASDAGDWISDTVSGAMDGAGNAAEDTSQWVSETYESLRKNGMTTAGNAKQWVQDDIKNMNAFEYKVVPKSDEFLADIENKLNALGADRWDCFEVDEAAFYFKRQRKSYLRNVPVKDLLKFLPVGGDSD